MLFSQQSRGRQNGHLFAAHHRNKSRPQSHLGFAKTHIAANQTVHGARADHVLNHRMNRTALVCGFIKAEIVGKHLVVLRGVSERVTLPGCTSCINIEQLGRRVAYLFGSAALGFVPLTRAQPVQRRFIRAHAAVATDQVQLADRHIQGGFVSVFEMQKLLQQWLTQLVQPLTHVHIHQATVAANAVCAVHHGVAHLQLRQIFDERLHIAHRFLFAAAPHAGACREQLGLGDQIYAKLMPCKPRVQAAGGNTKRLGAVYKLDQAFKTGWADAAGS